jgi:hypothetical protein
MGSSTAASMTTPPSRCTLASVAPVVCPEQAPSSAQAVTAAVHSEGACIRVDVSPSKSKLVRIPKAPITNNLIVQDADPSRLAALLIG